MTFPCRTDRWSRLRARWAGRRGFSSWTSRPRSSPTERPTFCSNRSIAYAHKGRPSSTRRTNSTRSSGIADRVTVLRDGHPIVTRAAEGFSEHAMAEAMVGRELSDLFPDKLEPSSEAVLEVRDLDVPGRVQKASFTLHRGEVLGFAGLVGAGRTELMEAIAGLRPATGSVRIMGRDIGTGSVQATRQAGTHLPDGRSKGQGATPAQIPDGESHPARS